VRTHIHFCLQILVVAMMTSAMEAGCSRTGMQPEKESAGLSDPESQESDRQSQPPLVEGSRAQDKTQGKKPPTALPQSEQGEVKERVKEIMKEAMALESQGRNAEAGQLLDQTIATLERAYPEYTHPRGHVDLARCLTLRSGILGSEGERQRAVEYAERALAMYRNSFPKEEYPAGHTELALSLDGLALALISQGRFAEAKAYFEEVLEIYQALYGKRDYPQGHPLVAWALWNLALDLEADGDHEAATKNLKEALAMWRTLPEREGRSKALRGMAEILDPIASSLNSQGKHAEAQAYAEELHAIYETLYPKERFPEGSAELARTLGILARILSAQGRYEQAEQYSKEALRMLQKLYPREKWPQGHPDVASALLDVAMSVSPLRCAQARKYAEKSVQMFRSLYPPETFPLGHPDLAHALLRSAAVLEFQCEYEKALECYQESLAILRHFQKKDSRGDAELVANLTSIGRILASQGKHDHAMKYCQEAVGIFTTRYSAQKGGNVDSAAFHDIGSLGGLFSEVGQFEQAQWCFEQQINICKQRYPENKYPLGHFDLARSLYYLGFQLFAQGDLDRARDLCQRSIDMHERLYPTAIYPQGYFHMEDVLRLLGVVLALQRDYKTAFVVFEHAAILEHKCAASIFEQMSEAEAFDFVGPRGFGRVDFLLSMWLRTNRPIADVYPYVWASRGMIQRAVSLRQREIQELTSSEHRKLYEEYVSTRRELARLTLAPVDPLPARLAERRAELSKLSARKEQLERTLAESVAEFRGLKDRQNRSHPDLIEHLPSNHVFVDLLRYADSEMNPEVPGIAGQRTTFRYIAFLLSRDRPIVCIKMGQAEPIDEAVKLWHENTATLRAGSAAETLRKLVWEPIEKHLPPGTTTIFLCPDAALTSIPWSALPGRKENTILLEEYSLATVPNGQFLLERLMVERPTQDQRGVLLAVGGVSYDDRPTPLPQSSQLVTREAVVGKEEIHWSPLPGTKQELDELEMVAGKRQVSRLTGSDASTARVLAELPKARWAHIATHGFFADPKIRSALQLDERNFARQQFLGASERTTVAGRNPLVMSGLVV